MDDRSYPYGDLPRALEQLGWLKSELDQKSTKTDLVELRAEMREMFHELGKQMETERKRELKALKDELKSNMDEAFKHNIPGIQTMIRDGIEQAEQDRLENQKKALEAKGLRIDEAGHVRPIEPWHKKLIRENAGAVIIGAIGIAIWQVPGLAEAVSSIVGELWDMLKRLLT